VTSIAAISGAAAIAVLAAAGTAHAQSAEAEALFNEGDSLMKQGKTAKACDAFEGSNKLEPRAGTMIRLGECREQNGQLASAWSAYKDALTRVKDEKKKKIATAKVKELEPRLSHLTIRVPDNARVEGFQITRNGAPFDEVLWNHALPVNGGQYTIYARALDHGEWSKTIKIANERADVELEVPKLDGLRKKAVVVTPSPDEDTTGDDETAHENDERGHEAPHHEKVEPPKAEQPPDEPPDEPPPDPSTFTRKRKVAIAFGVLGIGAGVIGVVFGRTASNNESYAFQLCPDPGYPCPNGDAANAKLEDARTQATYANVGLIAGGGLVATAVILWIVGKPAAASADVAITPHMTHDSTGLSIAGRF
jgi:hypothetical protein